MSDFVVAESESNIDNLNRYVRKFFSPRVLVRLAGAFTSYWRLSNSAGFYSRPIQWPREITESIS